MCLFGNVRRVVRKGQNKITHIGILMSLTLVLGACQSSFGELGLQNNNQQVDPSEIADPNALPAKTGSAVGEVIGFGPARIALLVPQTVPGNGAGIAAQIRNAAEMAMTDLGLETMELVIKDTKGTASGALIASQEAIREGAAVVLGPLFSSSVTSARSVVAQTNRPLIGFSTDPLASGPGSYLISFLPDQMVDRTVSYAISQGRRNFVSILPNGAYGSLVQRQLRESLAQKGGTLSALASYEYNNESVDQAIAQIADAAQSADVIFIPDGGTTPLVVTQKLRELGVDLSTKLLMGTGQWRSTQLNSPFLQGAVFADMDLTRFDQFKARYSEKYEVEPSVTAALGYDAVLLVGGLLKSKPGQTITKADIERSQGFVGASGIFRFLPDGRNQRGLSIYRVQNGEAVVDDPAPTAF